MLYYPFSCCGSIATLHEPQFLLLPTVTCVQSHHVPKSPAEMQNSQLWTLITFFGWVLLHHILPQILYIYIDHLSKVCSDIAQPKKSHFFMFRPLALSLIAPVMHNTIEPMYAFSYYHTHVVS